MFPIIPALGLQLGIAGSMIGLILSANRITRLIFDRWAGRLVDQLGARLPLSAGLCIECVGILCYSAALRFGHATWWLLTGRAVFGVGSALLFVGAQAAVLALSTSVDRGRRLASVRTAMSLGVPGGLVLGGLIADWTSDNAAFLSAAALTALGATAAVRLVSGECAHRGAAPIPHTPAALYALLHEPEGPFLAAAWGFNMLVFFSVQGVLLATLVLLVEKRGLHLFGLAAQGTAGLVMAAMMGCASAAALALGRVLDRRARPRTAMLLPALTGLSAGFIVLGTAHTLATTLVGAILIGLSYNGVTLPLLALLGDITAPERYGRAVALYQVFGDIGGTLGPIIGLEAGLHFGMLPTYAGVAAVLVLGAPGARWVRGREKARLSTRSG